MNAVWMPSLFTVFQPNAAKVAQLLPDVEKIVWQFPDLSQDNRYEAHLVSEAHFTFASGRVLMVPGFLLWKFLDMVIPGLGTKEAGYFDSNPYSSDYSENIAGRLRASYQACCVEGRPWEIPRPQMVIQYVKTGRVQASYRPRLSDETREAIYAFIDQTVPAEDSELFNAIRLLVTQETSRPKFDLGYKDMGDGTIGRTREESPWPDLGTVTFDNFLGMLSKDTRQDCPAQMSMLDKFSAIIEQRAISLGVKALAEGRAIKAQWYTNAARELGCKSQHPQAATLNAALAESDDRFVVFDILWARWRNRLKEASLGMILCGVMPPPPAPKQGDGRQGGKE